MVFAFKWGVRDGRTTVEAVRVNFRAPDDNYPTSSFASVKLFWLPKDWGLPLVYDRSTEQFCKETVRKKLDEDVGSFKAAVMPHWRLEAGGIDDDRALFTWMLSEKKFFASTAAVEIWNNVSLCTGVLSLMSLLFSLRFLPVPPARPKQRPKKGHRRV